MPTVDLNAYLREAYSCDAIEDDICSNDKYFLVATATAASTSAESGDGGKEKERKKGNGDVIGFAQLTEYSTEPCLSHLPPTQVIELQRLYVHSSTQGMGIGKRLMRQMEGLAKKMGYKYMWLGVWEGNFVAQRVYEGMGFERVGDHEFRMGRCIQTDWIMVKEL